LPLNSTFDITVHYSGDPTYQPVFGKAAQIWGQIITADIPDVNDPTYGFIDDLLIDASVVPIDGVSGILGSAGPDDLRAGSRLPDHGSMKFDSADVQSMFSSGTLLDVILHEMGHVLGIGTLWSMDQLSSGFSYTGANALAEYRVLSGNQAATSVPLETTGGAGTAGGHWSEAIFDKELMTGYIDGAFNPVSRVTVASLKDLGYTVDIGAADPYGLPGRTATDDLSGTARTSGQLAVDAAPSHGTIEVAGDHDWWGIQLTAGSSYTIKLTGAATGAGTLRDPLLRLYDGTGHLIVQDDDFGGTSDAQIDVSPSASSTYYVAAQAHNEAFTGTYTVSVTKVVTTPGLTFVGGPGADNLHGGAGNDVIDGGGGDDSLVGGDGNDTIFGGAGNDRIGGNGGDDIIVGQAGNDTIGGDDGNDKINGGDGNDTIFGGAGNDELGGGTGDDIIVGDDCNDTIFGEDGADHANGGAGNDILIGGAGNDELGGGADNDVIVGDDGDDTLFGEDGNDSINGGPGSDIVVGNAGDDQLGGGSGDDIVVGNDGNDTIFGEAGNDRLNGGLGNDVVIGGDGNDEVGGGAGNDDLNGGAGNDTLFGEDGSDTLNGSTGDDILLGMSGNDTFAFTAGDGSDTIVDFTHAGDHIWFYGSNLHSFADVQSHASFNAAANVTTISYGGGVLTLNGVTLSTLTADDFIFT
jgi:Ca2+-binding RTX toxin-like protein